MNKKKKREIISYFLGVLVLSLYVACGIRYEWCFTQKERIGLIAVFVIGIVAVLTTAAMCCVAEHERLWRALAKVFVVIFATMLMIPIFFCPSGAVVMVLFGTFAIFVLTAFVLFAVGFVLAILTEA